jgi:uncharacterized protein (TIGR03067 family)
VEGSIQLTGIWRHIAYEYDGERLPENAVNKMPRLVIKGDTYLAKEGDLVSEGSVTCGRMDDVNTIEFLPVCKTFPDDEVICGIYELVDDHLRLCFSRPGQKRPDKFKSDSGSGWSFTMLKRERSQ